MLCISRKSGERIKIGDDIEIVVRLLGNRVVVGVDAPREVRVLRSELISELDDSPGRESAA